MKSDMPNLDEAEVARFDAAAANWWDVNGEFRPLHRLAPARLTFIRDQIVSNDRPHDPSQPLAGISIVDVGCGGGLVTEPLARMGAVVTGIDPGSDTVEAARAHAASEELEIDYRDITIEALAESRTTFNAVLCLEVLEHVPDPTAFLASCASVLKPGGVLIGSTISRTMKSYALAIVAAEYVLDWVPRGTHDWNKFIRPDELQVMLADAGLLDICVQGIVFDPLADAWKLTNDTTVNYIASARKASA